MCPLSIKSGRMRDRSGRPDSRHSLSVGSRRQRARIMAEGSCCFEAERQYQGERYDELERLLTRYATLSDRFDDGRFKLTALQEFFDSFDAQSDGVYAKILQWRSARPR